MHIDHDKIVWKFGPPTWLWLYSGHPYSCKAEPYAVVVIPPQLHSAQDCSPPASFLQKNVCRLYTEQYSTVHFTRSGSVYVHIYQFFFIKTCFNGHSTKFHVQVMLFFYVLLVGQLLIFRYHTHRILTFCQKLNRKSEKSPKGLGASKDWYCTFFYLRLFGYIHGRVFFCNFLVVKEPAPPSHTDTVEEK